MPYHAIHTTVLFLTAAEAQCKVFASDSFWFVPGSMALMSFASPLPWICLIWISRLRRIFRFLWLYGCWQGQPNLIAKHCMCDKLIECLGMVSSSQILYDFATKSILCGWCSTVCNEWKPLGAFRLSDLSGKKLESVWNAEGQSPPFHIATLTQIDGYMKMFFYSMSISISEKSPPARKDSSRFPRGTFKSECQTPAEERRRTLRHTETQSKTRFVQPKGLWKGCSCSWIPFVTWRISTSVWGFWMGVLTIICECTCNHHMMMIIITKFV